MTSVTETRLWTALVTPFKSNGELDEKAFENLVARQLKAGVGGLTLFGSTGEAATCSDAEKEWCVKKALEMGAQVMIGITHNDTREVVRRAKMVDSWGVHALLIAAPFYNKPTQAGIVAHIGAVHDVAEAPIVLYNIPSRTGTAMSLETILELGQLPGVVGLKEASADLILAGQVAEAGLTVWSGDDPLILPYMSMGAIGGISVNGNLMPLEYVQITELAGEGRLSEARNLAAILAPWYPAVFSESNPIGIKAALAEKGLIENQLRLPLTPMTAQNTAKMRQVLDSLQFTLI